MCNQINGLIKNNIWSGIFLQYGQNEVGFVNFTFKVKQFQHPRTSSTNWSFAWQTLNQRCQGHEDSQEQRLKERSKSNFQTRNKTRLCDLKIRNTRKHNKNTKCAKPTWKWIFIMWTYINMNMKRIWQGYGVRSCLKLMLNILKEMKSLISIYNPLGT